MFLDELPAFDECTCSLTQVLRYQKRISGPLLDRIDIHIDVPRVEYEKLAGDRLGEASAAIQARAAERPRSETEGMERVTVHPHPVA